MATPPPGFRYIDVHTHHTPYPYEEERRPIRERALPDAVYRKIFHDNAARLLGI